MNYFEGQLPNDKRGNKEYTHTEQWIRFVCDHPNIWYARGKVEILEWEKFTKTFTFWA